MKLEVAPEWDSKLKHEHNIYWAISGIHGIPKMVWYGMEGQYNVMVLSCLGCTFEDIVQLSVLDPNTVFTYAKQMVQYVLSMLKVQFYLHLIPSFQFSSHCMIVIMFISMLNQIIS